MELATSALKVKPRLRGVSHLLAVLAAIAALLALVEVPLEGSRHAASVLYGISLIMLFGLSALYHVPMWAPPVRAVLRRADHGSIFFLIVGTYTPLAVLAAGGRVGVGLQLMWVAAIAGLVLSTAWSHMPRGLRAALYVVLGVASAPMMLNLPQLIGWPRVSVLLVGSAIYIAGAGVYALKRPDPWPRTFGYHEVFHVMVVLAAALQFAVVLDVQRTF